MTIIWGAVLALWTDSLGQVFVAGLTIASISYGAMLGVFLLGTWNRRANETGALMGFATGSAVMIGVKMYTPLAWTWYVLAGTIVTFGVGSLASGAELMERALSRRSFAVIITQRNNMEKSMKPASTERKPKELPRARSRPRRLGRWRRSSSAQ